MGFSGHSVYVIAEIGRNDIVKIGTCKDGARKRFKDGSYVNPRGLRLIACWSMPDAKTAGDEETKAQSLFTSHILADGVEWYQTSSPEDAVARVADAYGRPPDIGPGNLPAWAVNYYDGEVYDEFRDPGVKEGFYKGRLVQRRIWVHEEQGTNYKKISCNTWWCDRSSRSSNDKRSTFNTYRLRYTACLAIPVPEDAPDWEDRVKAANALTAEVYEESVRHFGIKDRPTGRAGWTTAGRDEIIRYLAERGFASIPVDPAKPPRGVKSLTFRGR